MPRREPTTPIVETISRLRESYDTRLSVISESIGGLKARLDELEQLFSELKGASREAIDFLKEARPQILLSNMKKLEIELEELKGRMKVNEEALAELGRDLREVKQMVGEFKGVEELLELAKEIREDIREVEELRKKTEAHADKIEAIFVDIHRKTREIKELTTYLEGLKDLVANLEKRVTKLEISRKKRP